MAAGGNISGKHSVIFSRMCVILEDEGKQAELNNEIENLMNLICTLRHMKRFRKNN